MMERGKLIWGVVAVVIGVTLTVLPLPYAILALAIGILGLAATIDIRVALAITLCIAPLKALLETEIPALATLPLDVGQMLLLFTFVLWLGHTAIRRKQLIRWTPMYLPLLVFIVFALPSMWNTLSLELSLKELAKWVEMAVIVALVMSVTDIGTDWLIAMVIMAACVQAGIGIYQFFGGSGVANFWILNYSHFRAFGSFGNPDPFGGFMSLGLCVAVGTLIYRLPAVWANFRQGVVRSAEILSFVLVITAVLLLSLGLLFSWSRGAWIGFGIAMVVMLLSFPRRRWIGMAMLLVVIVCVSVALAFNVVPAAVVARLSDFTQQFTGYDVRGVPVGADNYALIERLAHWQSAVLIATEHPWFGIGLGSYAIAYPRYALMNWPLALGHAHNYYLNLLAETGIVGLTGYLVAIVGVLWLIGKAYLRANSKRALVVGILGAWIGLSIHNAFDMLYVNNMYMHIGVLLGIVARLLQSTSSSQNI